MWCIEGEEVGLNIGGEMMKKRSGLKRRWNIGLIYVLGKRCVFERSVNGVYELVFLEDLIDCDWGGLMSEKV